MTHFDALKIYSSGKHCEKRRIAISPFLTMFSTLYGAYFSFYMHFLSAICFKLDQSKILSSGNGHGLRVIFGLPRMGFVINSISNEKLLDLPIFAKLAQTDENCS